MSERLLTFLKLLEGGSLTRVFFIHNNLMRESSRNGHLNQKYIPFGSDDGFWYEMEGRMKMKGSLKSCFRVCPSSPSHIHSPLIHSKSSSSTKKKKKHTFEEHEQCLQESLQEELASNPSTQNRMTSQIEGRFPMLDFLC